ncbi:MULTISPECIES: ligase-associated DNA damage response DEXH box helicase [Aphanothece]|uniref:ligase-associated DNA damage response DEXH box helicase n=1 Tax=Aphanothece TaxID=1121 RepID=UPI0039852CC2
MPPSIRTQLGPIETWFQQQGWTPLPFQRQCWRAYLEGRSGLIQVPTGSGKTYAAVMGPIAALLAEGSQGPSPGLRLLYLTPLRALSRDLAQAIQAPITAMGWPLRVAIRNGDTPSAERTRQLRTPPHILITTPESLSLLLANPRAAELFGALEAVVLDEWHELLGSKRGSQCELCLSWLRRLRPGLRTWAVSATLGNLEEAARCAVGAPPGVEAAAGPTTTAETTTVETTMTETTSPVLIRARLKRPTAIRSLLPDQIDGFPWAGHLGLRMYEELVAALDPAISTLLFTNTRNQAERWHQCLRYACPEMEDAMALHHSAIDRESRETIEAGVKSGLLRWVVCTSSLDLGVDFQPVERVVQIGSAKNLARLLQRAGRSAHAPGGTSQVLFLPTNALELLEVSAMRRGLAEGVMETRRPPQAPIDVLLQHLTTLACGPGFHPDQELATVRSAWSYQQLDQASWDWCLRFLEHGGDCLGAYPRFRKLERDGEGDATRLRVRQAPIARLHRLNIGTITSDRAVTVRFVRGAVLGHVEEAFIGRLRPGDVFFFAGRQLEFVRLREMVAHVKATRRRSSAVPAWAGGQMAISDLLSRHLRDEVDRCARALDGSGAGTGRLDTAELQALEPLLRRQADLSHLPRSDQFLVEVCRSREGSHLFAYPFEGRFVHEGIGFLWAWRLARHHPSTITVSVNDYGFELLAPQNYPFDELFACHGDDLLETGHLEADLEQAINLSELTRRRFRSIAQISGLVLNGYPGQAKQGAQLQISAALLFDVFQRHEPANQLLAQARAEVMADQLELPRIATALERLLSCRLLLVRTARPGPFAFPLLAERLNNRMSNESLLERLTRLREEAERVEHC